MESSRYRQRIKKINSNKYNVHRQRQMSLSMFHNYYQICSPKELEGPQNFSFKNAHLQVLTDTTLLGKTIYFATYYRKTENKQIYNLMIVKATFTAWQHGKPKKK